MLVKVKRCTHFATIEELKRRTCGCLFRTPLSPIKSEKLLWTKPCICFQSTQKLFKELLCENLSEHKKPTLLKILVNPLNGLSACFACGRVFRKETNWLRTPKCPVFLTQELKLSQPPTKLAPDMTSHVDALVASGDKTQKQKKEWDQWCCLTTPRVKKKHR